MLIELEAPVLEKEWGKFHKNLSPIPDFSTATKMTEEDFYVWSNNNGFETGDLNLDIFRKVTGKFLDTGILTKCYAISKRFEITPSVVVIGSAAYKTFYEQSESDWFGEMTGLDRMGPEGSDLNDFDILIPRKTMQYLSEKGMEFVETRNNSQVVIAQVEDNNTKVQIHALKNYDLNPLLASSFLSHTDLMAVSIVFGGPNAYFSDPFGSLENGPWEQKFPYRLFDSNNYLLKNEPRLASSVMIWALTSLNVPKIQNEKNIRERVAQTIKEMSPKQLISIVNTYLKYDQNEPYPTLLDDITSHKIYKLAKLGVLPNLLTKINESKNSNLVEAKETLLQSIGLFIALQHELQSEISKYLPDLTFDVCDQSALNNDYSQIEKLAKQINWETIANSNFEIQFNSH